MVDEKEQELGDRFRKRGEITKEDLIQVVEWKFSTLPGRKKRILSLISQNTDDHIRRLSREALKLNTSHDSQRIASLCSIYGVGPALASTILTFYDPKNYGVFDIHVWRELFGEKILYFTPSNYLVLLKKLREIALRTDLDVRAVEKALFKKNLRQG